MGIWTNKSCNRAGGGSGGGAPMVDNVGGAATPGGGGAGGQMGQSWNAIGPDTGSRGGDGTYSTGSGGGGGTRNSWKMVLVVPVVLEFVLLDIKLQR